MAEQKLLKMKNDFHLEVAGWIKKLSPDSNLEKEIGLHNPPQVSGYFCVKQSVFLWIVENKTENDTDSDTEISSIGR